MPQVTPIQQGGGGVSRDVTDCTSAPVVGNGTIGSNFPLGTTGVVGLADACPGVFGSAQSGDGVDGSSVDGNGVYGNSRNNAGVQGVSSYYWGVLGEGQGGVLGRGGGTGVWGQ